jgi:hypothetical protein
MRLPTFLLLGAPKCGTTALAHYLGAHPDVFLSRPKEPHFFDSDYAKGLSSYLDDHFGGWQAERVAGEATPSYLAIPWVPVRVRRDVPDARLIAILRDPVERAYSSWWMFHVRGMEPLSFEAALHENLKRLESGMRLEGVAGAAAWREHIEAIRRGDRIRIRTYLDSGYYARQLRRWFEHFPREQLRIVFSDDLKANRDAVVRALWRFLGVADDAALPEWGPVNEALGPGARGVLRMARATHLMRLRSLLPGTVISAVKRKLATFGGQPPLAPEMRERLLGHFEPHVHDLEQLLGVELDAWRR